MPRSGVAGDQVVEAVESDQDLLAGVGEPLAEGGDLGRHVVRSAGDRGLMVFPGPCSQASQGGDHPLAYEAEGLADDSLLDVLGEIAGGEPPVRLLVSGEGGELLQAGLDVVAQLPFPTLDGAEVDSIDHRAVVVDDLLGDVEALVALRLEDSDPQPALEHDPVLGREQLDHLRTGVTPSQDIGGECRAILSHGSSRPLSVMPTGIRTGRTAGRAAQRVANTDRRARSPGRPRGGTRPGHRAGAGPDPIPDLAEGRPGLRRPGQRGFEPGQLRHR